MAEGILCSVVADFGDLHQDGDGLVLLVQVGERQSQVKVGHCKKNSYDVTTIVKDELRETLLKENYAVQHFSIKHA